MNTKAKNATNYVDICEKQHFYAMPTKQGHIQLLVQPTAQRLGKNGARAGGASLCCGQRPSRRQSDPGGDDPVMLPEPDSTVRNGGKRRTEAP